MRAVHFLLKLISRTLPQWNRDKSFKQSLPGKKYHIATPVNFKIFPENFAVNFPDNVAIPERRIYVFKNVNILGAGIIFKNLRIFTPSLAWMKDFKSFSLGHILIQQWTKKSPEIKEPIAIAYDLWASVNYYHWMIDSLPRLLWLKKYFPECTLLTPEKTTEYISTTTQLLGFNKTIQLKAYEVLKAPTIIFPERTAPIGFQDPVMIKEARTILLDHFSIVPKKSGRHIYISRAKQAVRHLINEKDFLLVLEEYGFEIIYFEGLTLRQQAALVSDVSVAIGVNGSNLVNIFFMPAGATVIELMNKNVDNTCTYSLASSVSVKYYCIPCSASNDIPSSVDYVAANNADVFVDINTLRATLTSALNAMD